MVAEGSAGVVVARGGSVNPRPPFDDDVMAALAKVYADMAGEVPAADASASQRFQAATWGFATTPPGQERLRIAPVVRFAARFEDYLAAGGRPFGAPASIDPAFERRRLLDAKSTEASVSSADRLVEFFEARAAEFLSRQERFWYDGHGDPTGFLDIIRYALAVVGDLDVARATRVSTALARAIEGYVALVDDRYKIFERVRREGSFSTPAVIAMTDPRLDGVIFSELVIPRNCHVEFWEVEPLFSLREAAAERALLAGDRGRAQTIAMDLLTVTSRLERFNILKGNELYPERILAAHVAAYDLLARLAANRAPHPWSSDGYVYRGGEQYLWDKLEVFTEELYNRAMDGAVAFPNSSRVAAQALEHLALLASAVGDHEAAATHYGKRAYLQGRFERTFSPLDIAESHFAAAMEFKAADQIDRARDWDGFARSSLARVLSQAIRDVYAAQPISPERMVDVLRTTVLAVRLDHDTLTLDDPERGRYERIIHNAALSPRSGFAPLYSQLQLDQVHTDAQARRRFQTHHAMASRLGLWMARGMNLLGPTYTSAAATVSSQLTAIATTASQLALFGAMPLAGI